MRFKESDRPPLHVIYELMLKMGLAGDTAMANAHYIQQDRGIEVEFILDGVFTMDKNPKVTKEPKKAKEKNYIFSEEIDGNIGGAASGMAFVVIAIFVTFNTDYLINEIVTTVVRWLFLLFGTPITLACLLHKAKCNSNRLASGIFIGGLWLLLYLHFDFSWTRFLGLLLLFFATFLILQELFFLIYSLKEKPRRKTASDGGKSGKLDNANNLFAFVTAILGLALAAIQMLQQLGWNLSITGNTEFINQIPQQIQGQTSNGIDAKDWFVLIGVGSTFLVGILNIVISRHKQKSETITHNRMEWVNSVRLISADIISFDAYDLTTVGFNEKSHKNLEGMIDLISQLKLYLNFNGDYDSKIIKTVTQLEELVLAIPKTHLLYCHIEDCFSKDMSPEDKRNSIYSFLCRKENLAFTKWIDRHDLGELVLELNPKSLLDELTTTVDEDSAIVRSSLGDTDMLEMLREEFYALKSDFTMYMQIYLKSEWNRVKHEAKLLRFAYNERNNLADLEAKYNEKHGERKTRMSLREQLEVLKSNN